MLFKNNAARLNEQVKGIETMSRFALAVLAEAYTRLGNAELAADARRVLVLNEPDHPWLSGDWPRYPWAVRKLNPFAGERSPIDN